MYCKFRVACIAESRHSRVGPPNSITTAALRALSHSGLCPSMLCLRNTATSVALAASQLPTPQYEHEYTSTTCESFPGAAIAHPMVDR